MSVLAWVDGNPFNGTVFALLGAGLGILGGRLPAAEAIARGPAWSLVAGALMAIFGLVYPHFLEAGSVFAYVYAAPAGLVPCPTLSLVIGLALVAGGLGSRVWSLVLAGAGLFHGVFGIVRLGVYLDAGLLVGAAARFVRGLARRPPPTRPPGVAG